MADHYVRAIKEAHPRGPYQLGGFCFGGVVAYEMARQFEAMGDAVSFLAVLESAPPNLEQLPARSARSAAFLVENLYENLRDFVSLAGAEQLAVLKRKFHKTRHRILRRSEEGESQPEPALNELIDMSKYPADYIKYAETHWKALQHYLPGPYGGTIHLFRARKQPLRITDPSLGWNSLSPGRVKIEVISGTHEAMVTDPHVQVLAQKMWEIIRSAGVRTGDEGASAKYVLSTSLLLPAQEALQTAHTLFP